MKTKLQMNRIMMKATLIIVSILCCFGSINAQVNVDSLPMVTINLVDAKYYSPDISFANCIMQSKFSDCTSQDENGYIQNVGGGYNMFVDLIGVGIFPIDKYVNGEWILEWEGDGDLSLIEVGNTLVSEDLSGPIKQRVYNISPTGTKMKIRVNSSGATNVKFWAPGGKGKLFHPDFISRIKPFSVKTPIQPHRGSIRFMDWGYTNFSPISSWSERKDPDWASQGARGGNPQTSGHPTEQHIGTAWEYMIALCNETDMDMWVCFPHQVDADYVTKLAHLIKNGVDQETGRTCDPLNSHLNVYIEYSNEVWNWNFTQSTWVNNTGTGDNLDVKYVNYAAPLIGAFNDEFNDPDRVINVCGTQTASPSRAQKRLDHFATKPANQQAEVLGITSYYKLGMQDWVINNLALYLSDPTTFVDQFFTQLDLTIGPPNTAFQTSGDTHDECENIALDKQIADNFGIPVICYEGGSHMNPKNTGDDLVAAHNLLHAAKEHGISYKNWISRLHATGIYGHNLFTLSGYWGQYGQWGHMNSFADEIHPIPNEYVDANTVRYKAMLDYYELPYPVTNSCDIYATPAAFTFVALGEAKTLEITSEDTWTIDNSPAWISTSISGSTITVTAAANTGENRSGTIDISGACGEITVAVAQAAAFSLSETSLYYTEDASSKTVDITTEDAWTVSESISWLSVSPTSGSGSATITITVLENTEFERNGTITITSGTAKTIDVNQTNGAIRVDEVSFADISIDLEVGETAQLNPIITPSDAYDKTVTYSSLLPAFAIVDNSGLVTALAEGVTVITVTTYDGSFEATIMISVTEAVPQSVISGLKNKINVFPNPAQSIVNIHSGLNISKIEIYNCFGALVNSKNLNSSKNAIVDLNNLSSGLYIIRITDNNNNIHNRNIIKN